MMNIEKIWTELIENNSLNRGLLIRRISPEIVVDIFAGIIFPKRSRCLIIDLNSAGLTLPRKQKIFNDFQYEIRPAAFDSPNRIIIELNNSKMHELFRILCENLTSKIFLEQDETKVYTKVIQRLNEWEKFFSKANAGGLNPSEQIGLYGELWVMRELIRTGVSREVAIQSWVGCEGEIHDFQLKKWAIEVKVSGTRNPDIITISSEHQLDKLNLDDLSICNIIIGVKNQSGETLIEIVSSCRELLSNDYQNLVLFDTKLLYAGYFDNDIELYEGKGYYFNGIRVYDVRNDFPKITPNDIPNSINQVKYKLDLKNLEDFMIRFEEIIFRVRK